MLLFGESYVTEGEIVNFDRYNKAERNKMKEMTYIFKLQL